MPSRPFIPFLLCALLACGCSNGREDELFSADDAQAAARRYHEALSKGDVQAAVRLSRAPFRYKDAKRVWPDAASLQANLAKEIPRFRHLLGGLDRVEVFSRNDLLDGKWPRDREVPKDRRQAEIDALGIEPNGWLARVFSDSRTGYLIVLNPEGIERLAVQMIDI